MANVKVNVLETMNTVEDTAGVAEGHDQFASQVNYQVFGTWTGVVTFEGTIDNTNWFSVMAEPLDTAVLSTTTTDNGLFRIDASGIFTRCRFSTDSSGTVSVLTTWVIG